MLMSNLFFPATSSHFAMVKWIDLHAHVKKTMDFYLVRCHLLFFVGKRRRQLASHGWSGVA